MERTITELVKNTRVYFSHFRSGFFWYNLISDVDNFKYTFFVPIEDIGNATMLSEDKGITFMRWIRKAQENNELIQVQ